MMNQLEEILKVLRRMKKRSDGPLRLSVIFKLLIEEQICDSSKAVSECLKQLKRMGKINIINTGIDLELLENVKVEYIQSSLMPLRR